MAQGEPNPKSDPTLGTIENDLRTNQEILLSIERLLARLVFIHEKELNRGESTKEIKTSDVTDI